MSEQSKLAKAEKIVITKSQARKGLKVKTTRMNKKITEAIKLYKTGNADNKAESVKLLLEVEVLKKDLISKELLWLIHLHFGSVYWRLVTMNLQLDTAIFGIKTGQRTDKEVQYAMKQVKKEEEELEKIFKKL